MKHKSFTNPSIHKNQLRLSVKCLLRIWSTEHHFQRFQFGCSKYSSGKCLKQSLLNRWSISNTFRNIVWRAALKYWLCVNRDLMQVNAKSHFSGFPRLRLSPNLHKFLNAERIKKNKFKLGGIIHTKFYLFTMEETFFEFALLDVGPIRWLFDWCHHENLLCKSRCSHCTSCYL